MRDRFYSAEIIFQGNVFVGSVRVFIWQSKAEEHAGNLESIVHLRDERDRTTLANKYRLLAKTLFERGLRLLENGSLKRRDPRFAGAEHLKFTVNRFWQQFANMFLHERCNFTRFLIGNQARRKFREGLRWNHGFCAFAGVATPDAVEFESRAGPKLFHNRKTFFANITRSANGLFEIFLFPRQRIEGFALRGGKLGNAIVKTGNGDSKILVMQFRKQFGENRERIRNSATIHARMQIARRTRQFNLVIIETAQTISDGRNAFAEHGSIGHDERIGA